MIVCVFLQLQSRALTFAISMEKSLVNNLNIFSWLTKELKKVCVCVCVHAYVCVCVCVITLYFFVILQSAISKMLTQLSGRGQENCHVLKVWSHVIAVIGTVLPHNKSQKLTFHFP